MRRWPCDEHNSVQSNGSRCKPQVHQVTFIGEKLEDYSTAANQFIVCNNVSDVKDGERWCENVGPNAAD